MTGFIYIFNLCRPAWTVSKRNNKEFKNRWQRKQTAAFVRYHKIIERKAWNDHDKNGTQKKRHPVSNDKIWQKIMCGRS
jgi:hypothetical protein